MFSQMGSVLYSVLTPNFSTFFKFPAVNLPVSLSLLSYAYAMATVTISVFSFEAEMIHSLR